MIKPQTKKPFFNKKRINTAKYLKSVDPQSQRNDSKVKIRGQQFNSIYDFQKISSKTIINNNFVNLKQKLDSNKAHISKIFKNQIKNKSNSQINSFQDIQVLRINSPQIFQQFRKNNKAQSQHMLKKIKCCVEEETLATLNNKSIVEKHKPVSYKLDVKVTKPKKIQIPLKKKEKEIDRFSMFKDFSQSHINESLDNEFIVYVNQLQK